MSLLIEKRKLEKPPDSLVENGRFNFGNFNGPIKKVNLLEAVRAYSLSLPKFALNFRLKEWQAFQVDFEKGFFLFVIYNSKIAALVQIIYFDKEREKKFLYEKILPPFKIKMAENLFNSKSSWNSFSEYLLFENNLELGTIKTSFKMAARKSLPELQGNFSFDISEKMAEPMVVSIPVADNRAIYSHKSMMKAKGSFSLGKENFILPEKTSFAFLDFHKGFYPYRLKYDWVTGGGFTNNNELCGFNLTKNQSVNPELYNENCLWLNGKLHLLPVVDFKRPEGVDKNWTIEDKKGLVSLIFRPVMKNPLKLNFGLLKTDYYGPFGIFNGQVTDSIGNKIVIKDFYGMGEKKYLRG